VPIIPQSIPSASPLWIIIAPMSVSGGASRASAMGTVVPLAHREAVVLGPVVAEARIAFGIGELEVLALLEPQPKRSMRFAMTGLAAHEERASRVPRRRRPCTRGARRSSSPSVKTRPRRCFAAVNNGLHDEAPSGRRIR
jgi:hypothetical protein